MKVGSSALEGRTGLPVQASRPLGSVDLLHVLRLRSPFRISVDFLPCVTQKRPAVRAARLPLNPVLVAKQHRPKGYWKHKYIEKQETHPGKVAVRLE